MEPPEFLFVFVQAPRSGQYKNTEGRRCVTSGLQVPYYELYLSGTRNRWVSTIVTSEY